MSDVLDILLNGTARNVQREVPEQDYKVIRLSSELGQDVIFRLRALPYSTVAALRGDQNLCLPTQWYCPAWSAAK